MHCLKLAKFVVRKGFLRCVCLVHKIIYTAFPQPRPTYSAWLDLGHKWLRRPYSFDHLVMENALYKFLIPIPMDHLHYRLNFDLNKSRQKFHHSFKERHKISNIPKFRCEML